MRKLMTLTACAVLLSGPAAFAQSSIDGPGGAHKTGHTPVQTHTPPQATSHAASGRDRSGESCGRGPGPTTGHEPAPAATGKPAGPPANSVAVDQPGKPMTHCAPQRRLIRD